MKVKWSIGRDFEIRSSTLLLAYFLVAFIGEWVVPALSGNGVAQKHGFVGQTIPLALSGAGILSLASLLASGWRHKPQLQYLLEFLVSAVGFAMLAIK